MSKDEKYAEVLNRMGPEELATFTCPKCGGDELIMTSVHKQFTGIFGVSRSGELQIDDRGQDDEDDHFECNDCHYSLDVSPNDPSELLEWLVTNCPQEWNNP